MDVDSDIYGNLPNTDNNDLYEEIERLQQQNDLLQELINSLEGDIEKLCGKITEMKKIQDNLSKNISELFKTAKVEIERKDRIIAELRAQLDSFIQRKKSNFSMKRERDKSPSGGRPHVAKKMRHEEDHQVKHTHFKQSRSRSRSSERNRRLYNDRRDRHKYDYDSRRINVRDEKLTARGFKSKNYINKEHDKKEITRRNTTEVKNRTDAEEKKKVEELRKKKGFDKREVIIIIDKDDTIKSSNEHENTRIGVSNEGVKMDKESVQNDLKEVTKVTNNVVSMDIVGERSGIATEQREMNKASNFIKEDLKPVTEEGKRKRGLDQKKIAVKRNAKGILVKSHVVKAPNSKCNEQESKNDEKRVSDTNKTPLNKQSEENSASIKEKSGVKVNTTIIVETANKLKERLEEEAAKQVPQKATPLTLQFADFAKIGCDTVEVAKSKIVEVTRKLFEDSEDEMQEAAPVGSIAVDTVEICKRNVAKGVAGVKIEAVSKKLLGRLEEAKHDLKKAKPDDFKEVASQENKDEVVKTKNEVFMELFGSIDDETEDRVVPMDATVATKEVATDVEKNKAEEVDGRSKPEEGEGSAYVGPTVAVSEEIPILKGKDATEIQIDVSPKGTSDENPKQILHKPIPGCIKLDSFNEVDYKSEDETKQLKIKEISRNLFRKIVEADDLQKTYTTEVTNENEEKEITENRSKEAIEKSKSEYITVNLEESIKNSIDFTKKRHDMMYGEVSKEISMFVPQCIGNNTTPHKKEMTEDTKLKVNNNENNHKSDGEQKAQKVDRGRRKSESSKMTRDDDKIREGHLETSDDTEKKRISSIQKKDNKDNNEGKKSKVASKHQKMDKGKKKNESSKFTKDEKIMKEEQPALFNKHKVDKEGSKNTNGEEREKKKNESSKVVKDEKIREGQPAASIEQKIEKESICLIEYEDDKNTTREEKGKKKSESSKLTKNEKIIREGQSALFNEQKADKENKSTSSIQNEDGKNTDRGVKWRKKSESFNEQKLEKESISSMQNEDDENTIREEKGKKKSESSKLTKDEKIIKEGQSALFNEQKVGKEKKSISSIQNEDGKNTNREVKGKKKKSESFNEQKAEKESISLIQNEDGKNTTSEEKGKKDGKIREEQLDAMNPQKIGREENSISSIQNEDDKNTSKVENYVIVPQHQKIDKGKRKSISSKVVKDEKALNDQQIHKERNTSSTQNGDKNTNKEENSEVAHNKKSSNDKLKSPKRSSPKDSKPKKNTKQDAKNKDDDSSGSIVEESDRVLRSTTRRNSKLQEDTQKKITNLKGKKSEAKLDFNPHVEPSDFTTVNLSHDGEIPVLHIADDSHLDGTSELQNLENCQPIITSSPIKPDSNVSFNLSGLNGSNSFGETRIFNTSSGRKRRRVVLTMVD